MAVGAEKGPMRVEGYHLTPICLRFNFKWIEKNTDGLHLRACMHVKYYKSKIMGILTLEDSKIFECSRLGWQGDLLQQNF